MILDRCAAPGGKTAHILEHTEDTEVVAIDSDVKRLDRVYDNLERLQLRADVICGEGWRYLEEWWHGEKFYCDYSMPLALLPVSFAAILILNGYVEPVILKHCRHHKAKLETRCGRQLKPEGTLVYATCSVTPQEKC